MSYLSQHQAASGYASIARLIVSVLVTTQTIHQPDHPHLLDRYALLAYNTPMIELTIPGRGTLQIQHLVSDVNGTLAVDGQLIEGVAKRIAALRDRLHIHMLTADTHGKQAAIDSQLGMEAVRIQKGNEAQQKADYVCKLGAETVIALGQGANDAGMLKTAALGICVLSAEGAAIETLMVSDLLLPDILTALDLLDKPMRIVASLRK